MYERFLEPFANVLVCGQVSVKGASDYMILRLRQMLLPTVTTYKLIEILQYYMNQGDEALKNKLVDRA